MLSVRDETLALLKIAVPLATAYLAELAMFLTTKAVVGRLGYEELAAVGLAGHLCLEVLIIAMGLLSVVGVFVAQAHGKKNHSEAGHAARQGFAVAILMSIPLTLIFLNFRWVLSRLGQEPAVVELASQYMWYLAPSVFAVLGFAVMRSFVAALSRTAPIMVITILAVGLNYVLTLGLVMGEFGMPAMGVAGAGLANTLSFWAMLIGILVYAWFSSDLRGYGLFRSRLRIDTATCGQIMRLGVPVAGLVAIEAGLFMSVSVLSGILGAKTLAAYEILMSWVGIPFLIALGLAEAAMVRVALGMGQGSMAAARRSGMVSMTLGIVLIALLIVVPLAFPQFIVDFFLDRDDPGYDEILSMVTSLLAIVAIFQVFDGLQAVASRALRGLKDTIFPLWIAAAGYWVLGIGVGCYLTFVLDWGEVGLWWGLALGLIVTGSLLAWRFHRLTLIKAAT